MCSLFFLAAAGLRTPLAVPGPYPAPFGMVPHAGMNGELTSPGAAYASLHNMSPQMSAAAAAAAVVAYGRSPMVGGHSGWGWLGSRWVPRSLEGQGGSPHTLETKTQCPGSVRLQLVRLQPHAASFRAKRFPVFVDEKRQCLGATLVVQGTSGFLPPK